MKTENKKLALAEISQTSSKPEHTAWQFSLTLDVSLHLQKAGAYLKEISLLYNHFSFCRSSIRHRSNELVENWRPSFPENLCLGKINHIVKSMSLTLHCGLHPQDLAECLAHGRKRSFFGAQQESESLDEEQVFTS